MNNHISKLFKWIKTSTNEFIHTLLSEETTMYIKSIVEQLIELVYCIINEIKIAFNNWNQGEEIVVDENKQEVKQNIYDTPIDLEIITKEIFSPKKFSMDETEGSPVIQNRNKNLMLTKMKESINIERFYSYLNGYIFYCDDEDIINANGLIFSKQFLIDSLCFSYIVSLLFTKIRLLSNISIIQPDDQIKILIRKLSKMERGNSSNSKYKQCRVVFNDIRITFQNLKDIIFYLYKMKEIRKSIEFDKIEDVYDLKEVNGHIQQILDIQNCFDYDIISNMNKIKVGHEELLELMKMKSLYLSSFQDITLFRTFYHEIKGILFLVNDLYNRNRFDFTVSKILINLDLLGFINSISNFQIMLQNVKIIQPIIFYNTIHTLYMKNTCYGLYNDKIFKEEYNTIGVYGICRILVIYYQKHNTINKKDLTVGACFQDLINKISFESNTLKFTLLINMCTKSIQTIVQYSGSQIINNITYLNL